MARADFARQTTPLVGATREREKLVVTFGGRLTIAGSDPLTDSLAAIETAGLRALLLDLKGVDALDTTGAWLLHRFMRHAENDGAAVEVINASAAQRALLDRMKTQEPRQKLARPMVSPARAMVIRLGAATMDALHSARFLVNFFGITAVTLARSIVQPQRLRVVSLFSHIERIGLDALPIVGLLSFLIGVVLAYQGADQLRQFGAELFTVNLLAVSVLREIGVLMTAIMVAGRSGSAFTAEIGTMKVNEEVDAMRTLGIDPMEVLVIPRLLAMMISLPLLALFANFMALLGGGLLCVIELDLSVPSFLTQLRDATTVGQLFVGLVKAPVFAFLIALVGCYQGLRVSGSAESVGRRTTQAVVQSIFLVIVADAIFSIVFSWLRI
jgi:phospholipid/cholesterol/gamma-HCH transport system permease protein